MHRFSPMSRLFFAAIALAMTGLLVPLAASAGTTGTITGTVTDTTTGAAIANVQVAASSPTQSASATTNAKGFFAVQQLSPDEYTISFQAPGYEASSVAGFAVFQEQNTVVNGHLT